MALQLSILLIALSLPALLLRRGGGGLARFCALVAMSGVAAAVLDLPERLFSSVPARLTVVTTVPAGAAVTRALQTAVGEGVELEFATGTHHPADRLAGARLRRRQDPDVALVFNGRFAGRAGAGDRPPSDGATAQVLTARPVLPLDPESIRVRSMLGISKGRPAFFEVLLGVPGADRPKLRGRLQVLDPGGSVVCDEVLPGDVVERVEWRPVVEGRHRVQLTLQLGEGAGVCEMRGVGEVEVAAPPPITIVGAAAVSLADALRVQGLPVQVQKALPAELDGTLVLLDPLDVAQQQRVRKFVEDGGGVFLVGGPRGGALPPPTEPLGALAPVTRLALPPLDKPEDKSAGQRPKERSTENAEDPPPPVKEDKDPPKEETAAKGDTSGRRLKIEERDVHRRAIAMVLIVDRSGSMLNTVERRGPDGGFLNRMDLAKASAVHTASALDDGDHLAVISFGSSATVVLPLSPVQDRKQIREDLAGLRAKRLETTNVAGALDAARRMLVKTKAAVKHVVIVTDGAIHDAGPRYFGARAPARKFHQEKTGITLTLVQAVPLSEMEVGTGTRSIDLMAEANGVTFDPDLPFPYYVKANSFDAVPRLLITEVRSLRTKAGRPADKDKPGDSESKPLDKPKPKPEPESRPVPEQIPTPPPPDPPAATLEVRAIEESPLLAPKPQAGFPSIAGILKVEAHEEAMTLLVAGPEGTPLLAFANRGLGKIGVWTSDFLGPWGAAFCDEESFPGRLGQWIQFLAPARTVVHGVDVVRRPTVTPAVPLPADVAELERLGGNPIAPIDSLVPPTPSVTSEERGRAEPDAIYGILLLVLLALVEFLVWRRPTTTN